MPYTGPQIKDYGTVADLTAAHQLFSGVPGPSLSLLAFSHTTTPPTTSNGVQPTSANSNTTTPGTPSGTGPVASTGPLTTVSPGPTASTPSGGGPTGGGAHAVPGASGGKLPFTGLNVVGETLLGAGAVVSGFVARRFSRKPSE